MVIQCPFRGRIEGTVPLFTQISPNAWICEDEISPLKIAMSERVVTPAVVGSSEIVIESESQWFKVAVVIISGIAVVLFAYYTYTYYKLKTSTVNPIDSGETMTLLVLSSIMLVLSFVIFIWGMYRLVLARGYREYLVEETGKTVKSVVYTTEGGFGTTPAEAAKEETAKAKIASAEAAKAKAEAATAEADAASARARAAQARAEAAQTNTVALAGTTIPVVRSETPSRRVGFLPGDQVQPIPTRQRTAAQSTSSRLPVQSTGRPVDFQSRPAQSTSRPAPQQPIYQPARSTSRPAPQQPIYQPAQSTSRPAFQPRPAPPPASRPVAFQPRPAPQQPAQPQSIFQPRLQNQPAAPLFFNQ